MQIQKGDIYIKKHCGIEYEVRKIKEGAITLRKHSGVIDTRKDNYLFAIGLNNLKINYLPKGAK